MASLDLSSGIGLELAAVPKAFLDAARRTFSMPNPAYVAAARAGRSFIPQPMRLTGYTLKDGRVRFARGVLSELRKLALTHGVDLSFIDERTAGDPLLVQHRRELRDYQLRAVDEIAKRQQGIIVAPAGSGKTTIACGAIARVQRSALVVVGALDLAVQWRTELLEQLGVKPGMVGAGSFDIGPITVATVATLAKLDDDRLCELLARFGVLIVDEAHHVAARSWWRIVDRCPAKFRIGLSATPEREDGTSQRLRWLIGPQLETVAHAQLLESGRLVAPRVVNLLTRFAFNYTSALDWQDLLTALVADDDRNEMILERVAADARGGHSCLVLTGRVAHAERLATELEQRGIRAAALTGETPKKLRTERLRAAREGELSVLVATSLADEGLDLPRLSRVYLTFPAKAAGRIEQRIGRVMRPAPGKTDCAVVDVVDVHVGVLAHQAHKRRHVFATVLGADVEDVPELLVTARSWTPKTNVYCSKAGSTR